jgi:hypothetical protein
MLIRDIGQVFDVVKLKKDSRKLGVNLITAGIAGTFLNHFEGIKVTPILWSTIWVIGLGSILLISGLKRGKK